MPVRKALSRTEVDIIRWCSYGLTNQQIASVMHLSVSTIKTHLERIGMKTGTQTRASKVAYALREGIIR